MASINGWWFVLIGFIVLIISSLRQELLFFRYVAIVFVLYGLIKLGIKQFFSKKKQEEIKKHPHNNHTKQHNHQDNIHKGHHHPQNNIQNHNLRQQNQMQYNQQQGIFFCRNCGKKLGIHDNFCSNCGTRIK
jgi:disulfide bond formation protein DsbB